VPYEYWANHQPYRLRRITSKQGEIDELYEKMKDKANRSSMTAAPEYNRALKEYMDRIDEYEGGKGATTETNEKTAGQGTWYTLWCIANNVEDPKEVTDAYWRKHRPYILQRRSSAKGSSDSADGDGGMPEVHVCPESGKVMGKYADDEYDEVRKVRMELEKRLQEAH
jgi:hypothetical protein